MINIILSKENLFRIALDTVNGSNRLRLVVHFMTKTRTKGNLSKKIHDVRDANSPVWLNRRLILVFEIK